MHPQWNNVEVYKFKTKQKKKLEESTANELISHIETFFKGEHDNVTKKTEFAKQ